MQVLNLEEKNTERMEAINKFTLMDDTFMTQVFSGDLECTEELLKIILKRNDLSVTKLKSVYLIATRDLRISGCNFFYLKIKGLCDFLRKRF